MKAVILVGGEGQRLRPYTKILPKPLLPLGEKPLLEIILERLKKFGIKDVILLTNYKAKLFELLFGDGKEIGMNIEYSKESKPLGTAGPLSLIKEKLDKDFIVMNGDILTDLNFNELVKFHKKNKADLTIVTKEEEICFEYGIIKIKGKKVIGWEEKPVMKEEISTGIYVINSSVLKYLKKNQRINMDILINKLIKNKCKVLRFFYSGKWIDVGRLDDHKRAQEETMVD